MRGRNMRESGWKKALAVFLAMAVAWGQVRFFAATGQEVQAVGEATFSINADRTEVKRGDTFHVTVNLSDNTVGEGLTYFLVYDVARLELVEATKGEILKGLTVALLTPLKDEGKVSVVASPNESGTKLANGSLMNVTFQVKADAPKGKVSLGEADVQLNDGDPKAVGCLKQNNANGLTVIVPTTGLTLDQTQLSLEKGGTDTLTATRTPSDADSEITWATDNAAVATVTQAGAVTAVGGGEATITATSGAASASCKIRVSVPLAGISINAPATTVKRGGTTQLAVVYNPTDTTADRTVRWTTSGGGVARVNEAGLVTGLKEGTETITAEAGGKTATVDIAVTEARLESVSIKKGAALVKGASETLELIYSPAGTTDGIKVSWASKDPAIATVNPETGDVKGLKEGATEITATVTATDGSGVSKEYTASVKAEVKEIPLESIAFDRNLTEMKTGEEIRLNILFNPEDTTDDRTAEWFSSDESVLSVKEGLVRALKEGSACITAKVGDRTATCDVTVKRQNPDFIEKAIGDIAAAQPGQTVTVDTAGATVVSREVLEAAKGKDVTIELKMGGYTWLIDGKAITGEKFGDINMGMELHTKNIAAPKLEGAKGARDYVTLTLAHTGDFGFKGVLKVNIGARYAGRAMELYYDNPMTGNLERQPENSQTVGAAGEASLSFTHASDYVVYIEAPQDSAVPRNGTVPQDGTVPQNGDGTLADTGDQTNAGIYVAGLLLAAGVAGVAVALRIRRKKAEN